MSEAPVSVAAPDRVHGRIAHRSGIAPSRLPERGVIVHLTINSLSAALIAAVVAGCGGGSPATLNADQATRVANIEVAFATTALNGRDYGQTLHGVDYLIALCRRDPAAVYQVDKDRRTVKQVLEDGANTLRPYQPDLARSLDRVLDDGCR